MSANPLLLPIAVTAGCTLNRAFVVKVAGTTIYNVCRLATKRVSLLA